MGEAKVVSGACDPSFRRGASGYLEWTGKPSCVRGVRHQYDRVLDEQSAKDTHG